MHALLPWLLLPLALGQPAGWRHDGTGVFDDAATPNRLSLTEGVVWSTDLPAWGNGSPVLAGDLVCVTEEPTGLVCLGRDDGRVRWRADNDVVDTLPAAEQAVVRDKLARAAAVEAELATARRDYSRMQREARRASADPDLPDRLTALSRRVDALTAELAATAAYRTPSDNETIGYASPTPLFDGERLYVVYGHGVVSAFDRSGTRLWSRWLGPHEVAMRGYRTGSTTSPVLAGGHLIVGYGQLTALDPATGATVWTGPTWSDYGTPAVASPGGLDVIATPQGRLIRATDGAVLHEDLADIWYIGPVVSGDTVVWLGARATGHDPSAPSGARATAVRLARTGDTVSVTPAFDTPLDTRHTFYAPPVAHDGRLYAVTHRGELHVLSLGDGRRLHRADLSQTLRGDVFPSPVIAGDALVVLTATGSAAVLTATEAPAVTLTTRLAPLRATPVMQGDRAWLRTLDGVRCLDVTP